MLMVVLVHSKNRVVETLPCKGNSARDKWLNLTVHGGRAGVLGRHGLGRARRVHGQLLRWQVRGYGVRRHGQLLRWQVRRHGIRRHGLLGRKVGRVLVLDRLRRDGANLFVDNAAGRGRAWRVDGRGEEVGLFDGLDPDGGVPAVVGDEGEDEEDEDISQHCAGGMKINKRGWGWDGTRH